MSDFSTEHTNPTAFGEEVIEPFERAVISDDIQGLLSESATDHEHRLSPEELDDFLDKQTAKYTQHIDQRFGEIRRASTQGRHAGVLLADYGSFIAANTEISDSGPTPLLRESLPIRLMDSVARQTAMRDWVNSNGWLDTLDAAHYVNQFGSPLEDSEPLRGLGILLATPKDAPIAVYLVDQTVPPTDPKTGSHVTRSLIAVDWPNRRRGDHLPAAVPRPDRIR